MLWAPYKSSNLVPLFTSAMVAVFCTLSTLLLVNKVQSLPIHRYLENVYTKKYEPAPEEYGFNEADTGYSNKTLQRLQANFYSEDGITRDVFVKNVHSHNDYWRARPLLEAIALGVRSVEADVWSFPEFGDESLYVGHSVRSLSSGRTLESLYLNPLMSILKGSNNENGIHETLKRDLKQQHDKQTAGVFATDSSATLFLFIDFKTSGDELYDLVHDALDHLRDAQWLTYYNATQDVFHWRPITVIGTGLVPFDRVFAENRQRDIFFDAPLDKLNGTDKFNYKLSPIASCSLGNLVGSISINRLDDTQKSNIKEQVQLAHEKGMLTRVWDTPSWPVIFESAIWRSLVEAGSDLINADNLEKIVSFE